MGLPVTYQSKVRPWSQVSLLSVMSSGVYPPPLNPILNTPPVYRITLKC